MSEDKFDFGSMVSDQMRTFRPGFKFPGSFNDLKQELPEPDPFLSPDSRIIRESLVAVSGMAVISSKHGGNKICAFCW